jgi:hypothetical protein
MAAFGRGLDYLYGLRSGLPQPELISLMLHPTHRESACLWIGEHIQALNAQLNPLLEACEECILPALRPQIHLFAAPLSPQFGLDGLCCLPQSPHPTRILLDLGVLEPQYWLNLLVHEYAHAVAAAAGHDLPFQRALSALCLGLDLELRGADWPTLPSYPRRENRLSFWLGCPEAQP